MTHILPDERDPLVAHLAGRDHPRPQCGYNLRDLADNRCPEGAACGEC